MSVFKNLDKLGKYIKEELNLRELETDYVVDVERGVLFLTMVFSKFNYSDIEKAVVSLYDANFFNSSGEYFGLTVALLNKEPRKTEFRPWDRTYIFFSPKPDEKEDSVFGCGIKPIASRIINISFQSILSTTFFYKYIMKRYWMSFSQPKTEDKNKPDEFGCLALKNYGSNYVNVLQIRQQNSTWSTGDVEGSILYRLILNKNTYNILGFDYFGVSFDSRNIKVGSGLYNRVIFQVSDYLGEYSNGVPNYRTKCKLFSIKPCTFEELFTQLINEDTKFTRFFSEFQDELLRKNI